MLLKGSPEYIRQHYEVKYYDKDEINEEMRQNLTRNGFNYVGDGYYAREKERKPISDTEGYLCSHYEGNKFVVRAYNMLNRTQLCLECIKCGTVTKKEYR